MGSLENNPNKNQSFSNIIDELSAEIFIERWKDLVGEPPAAMLESRRQMLMLLVQSLPVKSLTPTSNPLPPLRFTSL